MVNPAHTYLKSALPRETKEIPRTVDDYVNAAMKTGKFKSERELSRALKLGPTAVNNWRTGRAWPSDKTIIQLAYVAMISTPEDALIDLATWRSKDDYVRSVWVRVHEIMQYASETSRKTAGVLALILSLTIPGTGQAQSNVQNGSNVYYGKLSIIFYYQIISIHQYIYL